MNEKTSAIPIRVRLSPRTSKVTKLQRSPLVGLPQTVIRLEPRPQAASTMLDQPPSLLQLAAATRVRPEWPPTNLPVPHTKCLASDTSCAVATYKITSLQRCKTDLRVADLSTFPALVALERTYDRNSPLLDRCFAWRPSQYTKSTPQTQVLALIQHGQ